MRSRPLPRATHKARASRGTSRGRLRESSQPRACSRRPSPCPRASSRCPRHRSCRAARPSRRAPTRRSRPRPRASGSASAARRAAALATRCGELRSVPGLTGAGALCFGGAALSCAGADGFEGAAFSCAGGGVGSAEATAVSAAAAAGVAGSVGSGCGSVAAVSDLAASRLKICWRTGSGPSGAGKRTAELGEASSTCSCRPSSNQGISHTPSATRTAAPINRSFRPWSIWRVDQSFARERSIAQAHRLRRPP